jgi:hypothetical protein
MIRSKMLGALAIAGAVTVASAGARAQGACSNPAITAAYTAAIHRAPIGSGNSSECNPANYGTWSSAADLQARVLAYTTKLGTNGSGRVATAPSAPVVTAVPSSFAWYVDSRQNLIDNSSKSMLAAAGTYDLRNPDGSAVSLVASGGGNLVASGGGNLVASGGGNLAGQRSLQSVGGKKVFIVKK